MSHVDAECRICRNYCPECSVDLRRDDHTKSCVTGQTFVGQQHTLAARVSALGDAVMDALPSWIGRWLR